MLPTIDTRPTSGAALLEELALRAATAGLRIDCPADGSFNAELAIVAEAPGTMEVNNRSPLTGGSGNLLWAKLRRHGIERRQCWVTNVCKRQVSLSKEADERDVVPRSEAEHWEALLRWELSCLPNLRFVLVLGGPALAALSDHRGIEQWRGTVEQRDGVWFIYTYNPAAILRKGSLEPVFQIDVWKLDAVMRGRYREHRVEPFINPSPDEVVQYLDKLQDEAHPIATDIEVVGGETACIGFANNAKEGICVSFRRNDRSHAYSLADEQRVRLRAAKLLSDDAVRLVVQNGAFDPSWLRYKDRMPLRRVWFDTLLGHHTLYPLQPHSLAFLTAQYTWHPYYKNERSAWREAGKSGNIDDFWRYNVIDCCITWECHRHILRELQQAKLDKFFFEHVMRVQPYLTDMTVNGVLCDVTLKEKVISEVRGDVEQLRRDFRDAVQTATGEVDYDPNPQSPIQLRNLFFNKLRLVARGTAVDEDNRKRMLDHPRTPEAARVAIRALDKLKKESKFLSTYAEMVIDDDNRIRCEYRQFGTTRAPGRLSSAGTLWGTGANLQNQPERAKVLFVADPDHVFVYFDLSQAEARYVAWDARIAKWIEQFERARIEGGYDAHRALASEMFKVPYDEVPEKDWDEERQPTIRYIAKRCRHGLNYRMGPDKLATETGLPMHEAVKAYTLYHRATPELVRWWGRLEREAKEHSMLFNSYGRRLLLQGKLDDSTLESIVAFRPQSTIGDHVVGTIYLCMEDARWPKESASLVLNIHDALIALCHRDVASLVARIMQEHASRPILVNGSPMIIPAELAVSIPDKKGMHRWSTLKKVKSVDDISKIVSSN